MTTYLADTDDLGAMRRLGGMPKHMIHAVAFLARYTGDTHNLYRRGLNRWLTWCDQQSLNPLEDIKRLHVELYVRELIETGLKPSTIGSYFTPVSGYYKLALADDIIMRDPTAVVRLPKIQYAQKAPFDRDDMRRLIRCAKDCGSRHYALVMMLASMGMRATETCLIDVPDVYNTENGYRVLRFVGKGSKPAAIPIPYTVIPVLEAAAAGRTSGPLLAKNDGGRMNRHGVHSMVTHIGVKAGFARTINPHLLRAAAITLGLDSGADLREMQDFARHEHPRTTRRHYDLSKGDYATHASHLIGARLAV